MSDSAIPIHYGTCFTFENSGLACFRFVSFLSLSKIRRHQVHLRRINIYAIESGFELCVE